MPIPSASLGACGSDLILLCLMSGFGGSSIRQRDRLIKRGLLLFRLSTLTAGLSACGLDYFMLCLRSGLGGSSIKQRGRLHASGLLLFRLFTLSAYLCACGLDYSLLCLKISLGGSSIRKWDRLLSGGLLRLHMLQLLKRQGLSVRMIGFERRLIYLADSSTSYAPHVTRPLRKRNRRKMWQTCS